MSAEPVVVARRFLHRGLALAVLGAVALAGCGSSSDTAEVTAHRLNGGRVPPSPTIVAPPLPDLVLDPDHLPPEAGELALNADMKAAVSAIFDSASPAEEALSHVEHGELFADALELARAHPKTQGMRIEVLSAERPIPESCADGGIDSDQCGFVRFQPVVDGGDPIRPFGAYMFQDGDRWVMTARSYCDVLRSIAVVCPDF